ncbi:Putative peptidase M24, creatinase/aminopeptidase, winged helix-like DNA-binding domain superfamily [Septoria linicola]|uniref:Methionine aminopeptidase 2 n=1 Tax=Septoria linicola TaxID=215465 RepID=A0A9Q9B507_9PEZI|nr:putative peptidase M24, creatinase/aminopeptidase, winged helix-like DNA-binding domain superfamily [Septoria linicola]USW59078.1 Putative peptidase M24, creatinase/aminopeptidase, winged helix-like DNA-binding domain superfamily [Septoria linicola]
MGSKTPDGHQQGPDGNGQLDRPCDSTANRPLDSSSCGDLDRGIVGEEDGDGSDEEARLNGDQEKKQKKRKPRKKKSKSKKSTQTSPPTIELSKLFPSGYPVGELVPYENTSRTTDEELRYDSRLWGDDFLPDYRKAAEIHRQVRQHVQKQVIKPGVSMQTIADAIEDGVHNLTGHQALATGDALQAGMGFPTGLCLNNVAAHWTPNPGGKDVFLQQSDVLSVDFGVHVNGRIVDSAFTISHDPTFDPLLKAVKEATNTGIAYAGVDARMSEIGAAIQEVMESYEVVRGGKALPVRAIRNITGHDILRYHIHGDKQVPFVKNDSDQKMEEGEVYAIETFGSTGRGSLRDDVGIYGYGRQDDVSVHHIQPSAKSLLKTIDENFGSIVFCRRYLERLGVQKYHFGMKQLIDQGIVESHAPLVDREGSHVAQFEHTILIGSGGKEVISRGEDY